MASPTNELISTGSLRAVADASFLIVSFCSARAPDLALFICDRASANYRSRNGGMARDRPSPYETRRGVRHVSRLLAIRRAQITGVSVVRERPILPCLFAIRRSQTTDGETAAWRGTGPRPTQHGGVFGHVSPLFAIRRSQTTEAGTAARRGTGPRLTRRGAA